MRRIHRARLALVAAGIAAGAIVVVELPVTTLVHQRGAVASASEKLSAIRAENARLAEQVAALEQPSKVAAIAHADYGLVKAGQVAYTILPRKGQGSPGALSPGRVPAGDLVPPAVSPFGAGQAPGHRAQAPAKGLWSRVLDRLAFWRSVF